MPQATSETEPATISAEIERRQAERKKIQARAEEKLWQILRRAHKLKPGDGARVLDLAADAGFSSKQVEDWADLAREIHQLKKTAADRPNRERRKEQAFARREELAEQIEVIKKERATATMDWQAAIKQTAESIQAAQHLDRLRQREPRLFA